MDVDWTLKASDAAVVIATLLGPILAVQAQTWLDRRRRNHEQQMRVFHALMHTRGRPLSFEHVQTLNAVPLEFPAKKHEAISNAWKVYIGHFNKDTSAPTWLDRRLDLLLALLKVMAEELDYRFDDVELQRGFYSPIAHDQVMADTDAIRAGLAEVLRGKSALPLEVRQMPADPALGTQVKEVLGKLDALLDAKLAGLRDSNSTTKGSAAGKQ